LTDPVAKSAPSQEDFEIILREMPRFELVPLPDSISAGYWKFGGKSILRARMVASLRERIGAQLEQALYLYGIALSQWSEHTVRKLERRCRSPENWAPLHA
jgi:hypothetical protein